MSVRIRIRTKMSRIRNTAFNLQYDYSAVRQIKKNSIQTVTALSGFTGICPQFLPQIWILVPTDIASNRFHRTHPNNPCLPFFTRSALHSPAIKIYIVAHRSNSVFFMNIDLKHCTIYE